ncbi:MAG: hypothetical protein OXF61_05265 [Acidimicrobiaceae bacterium]|nr:hypothetical protein [Acidimicrobiaceae bacterium]
MTRNLVGALVAITLVLSPWESGLLPEPLDRLAAEPASAQTDPNQNPSPGAAVIVVNNRGGTKYVSECEDLLLVGSPPRWSVARWTDGHAMSGTRWDRGANWRNLSTSSWDLVEGLETPDGETPVPVPPPEPPAVQWSTVTWIKGNSWPDLNSDGVIDPDDDRLDLNGDGVIDPDDDSLLGPTSLCWVPDHPSCPDSPLNEPGSPLAGREQMQPSDRTGLCEVEANNIDPRAWVADLVTDCIDSRLKPPVLGVPVPVDGEHGCKFRSPAGCPPGLFRISNDSCRGYLRRPWTCPSGYSPGNQFKVCLRDSAPSRPSTAHGACGPGAPLQGEACVEYVGIDVNVDASQNWRCSRYSGIAKRHQSAFRDALNSWWCEYSVWHLEQKCVDDQDAAGCDLQRLSQCLKRTRPSNGGCDAVATAMLCVRLRVAYQQASVGADKNAALAKLRAGGCVPCVVLPFDQSDPHCAAPGQLEPEVVERTDFVEFARIVKKQDRYEWPHPGAGSAYWKYTIGEQASIISRYLQTEIDPGPLGGGCSVHGGWKDKVLDEMLNGTQPGEAHIPPDRYCPIRVERCVAPSVGDVGWTSAHPSGSAVVNAAVTLRVSGLPLRKFRVNHFTAHLERIRGVENSYIRLTPAVFTGFGYKADTGTHAFRVDSGKVTEEKLCFVISKPKFTGSVEQLWPDGDAAEIERLFGDGSLDWWNDLTLDEKRHVMEVRGWRLLDDLIGVDEADERARRAREGVQEFKCDDPDDPKADKSSVVCIWKPTRSGYFAVRALGEWEAGLSGKPIEPMPLAPVQRTALEAALGSDDPDSTCPDHIGGASHVSEGGYTWTVGRERDLDCLREDLGNMGLTALQAGLEDDLSALLPLEENGGPPPPPWDRVCPVSLDLRYRCDDEFAITVDRLGYDPEGHLIRSYSSSEPIGVIVHDAQVTTRSR